MSDWIIERGKRDEKRRKKYSRRFQKKVKMQNKKKKKDYKFQESIKDYLQIDLSELLIKPRVMFFNGSWVTELPILIKQNGCFVNYKVLCVEGYERADDYEVEIEALQ